MGGKLAEFYTPAQFNEAVNFLKLRNPSGNNQYWIGLTDRKKEGIFRWQSTGKQAIYTNWLPTQPDNWQGNEDCATLKDLASRQWNDSPCSDTIYYALCVRGLYDVGHQLEQQKSYVKVVF